MKITIIGTGFVGVVTAAVYASLGHQVTGLDIDKKKIKSLQKSQVPFYEPQLTNLLKQQQQQKRLKFTTSYAQAVKNAELVIIAVGTPSAPDGQADLSYVFASCESLALYLKKQTIVAIKSTVPPGTLDQVKQKINQARQQQKLSKIKYYLAALPEFLREGSAVQDTLKPDRVLIGTENSQVFQKLQKLHQPFKAPIVQMKPASAQMAKYAANAYLATRITFANQIADLCQKNGADIEEVLTGIGLDKRIGPHYWYPGLGYGGSCFPKDVKELAAYSRAIGEGDNILNKVNQINENRIPKLMRQFAKKLAGWQNKVVAVLGLSFKPHTDDLREAPATKVIPILLQAGAKVNSYDPMAQYSPPTSTNYQQFKKIKTACQDADVIIALIEWPEILSFDFSQVKTKKHQWFIDARNQFKPKQLEKLGYDYLGIGR
ncbi:MAG: nucleotide sugar dehydrogenase [Candidatus Pacebacteria bacterium]|nr:nucleotide sugar dehydrogenase [Candidatus Paceibacterota bacterium]